jgi:hypothetical protein
MPHAYGINCGSTISLWYIWGGRAGVPNFPNVSGFDLGYDRPRCEVRFGARLVIYRPRCEAVELHA